MIDFEETLGEHGEIGAIPFRYSRAKRPGFGGMSRFSRVVKKKPTRRPTKRVLKKSAPKPRKAAPKRRTTTTTSRATIRGRVSFGSRKTPSRKPAARKPTPSAFARRPKAPTVRRPTRTTPSGLAPARKPASVRTRVRSPFGSVFGKKPRKPAARKPTVVRGRATTRATIPTSRRSAGFAGIRGAASAVRKASKTKKAMPKVITKSMAKKVLKSMPKKVRSRVLASAISKKKSFADSALVRGLKSKKGRPLTAAKAAAAMAKPSVVKLALKAPILKASMGTKAAAIEAIKPHACQCNACPHQALAELDRSMGCDGYPPGAAQSLLAQLHAMTCAIDTAANQRLATHEHSNLMAKHAFEKKVLSRLSRLSKGLPKCHKTRTRANLAILQRA